MENITSDITVTSSYSSVPRFLTRIDTGWDVPPVSAFYSGASAPTGSAILWWYDTENNLIKMTRDSGSTWTSGYPLPLAIVHTDGTQIVSIDKIFNGFGYIGSTVFALPGVKVQIPNGKNEDGTFNNIIAVNNSVKLSTVSSSDNGDKGWYVSSTFTISFTAAWVFNYEKNCYINSEGNPRYAVKLAVGSITSGKITSFEPFTVDSVANSNASNFSQAGRSYLSGLGMPSGRYIDLTLGASNSTYTAPANGTVLAIKRAVDVGQNLGLARVSSGIFFDFAWNSVANSNIFVNMDVRKGEVFGVSYTASGTEVQILRFYYAEGEE